MCYEVPCTGCGNATFAGCGRHVDAVRLGEGLVWRAKKEGSDGGLSLLVVGLLVLFDPSHLAAGGGWNDALFM